MSISVYGCFKEIDKQITTKENKKKNCKRPQKKGKFTLIGHGYNITIHVTRGKNDTHYFSFFLSDFILDNINEVQFASKKPPMHKD